MKLRYVFLIILGVGILTYFNSLFNPFIFDDEQQIVGNIFIRKLSNIPFFLHSSGIRALTTGPRLIHSFYRPTPFIAYTFLFHFFGLNVFFYHLFQVLIHIFNSFLVFLVFSSFLAFPISFFLSLIFLVHPINSETATYAANLQDTLFLFFGLLALYIVIKKKHLLTSFQNIILLTSLLVLSLLSKETGLLFLLALPLYTYLFSRKNFRRIVFSSFMSFSIYLIMRIHASFTQAGTIASSLISRSPLSLRILSIPKIISFYFIKFIIPTNFAIAQEWLVKKINFNDFYMPLILDFIFLGIIFCFGLYVFNKTQKFKVYVFFSSILFLGLLINLQLFPLDATVANRWFYFPIIGLLGTLGIFASEFFQKKRSNKAVTVILSVLGALIVIVLLGLTVMRNAQWQTPMTLYEHDLRYAEDSPTLNGQYGLELMVNDNVDEAKFYLERSIKLDPLMGANLESLALFFELKKDFSKAKSLYWQSIYLNNGIPKAIPYRGLTHIALFDEDKPDVAKELAATALKMYPWDTQLLFYSAIANYFVEDKVEALREAKILLDFEQSNRNKYLYYLIESNQLTKDKVWRSE